MKLRVGLVGAGFIARTHVDAPRRACMLFPELGIDVAIEVVADVTLPAAPPWRCSDIAGIKFATADGRRQGDE